MAKTLDQLEAEMVARFRDLEIAEQRGLNAVALERLYQAYLRALAAWRHGGPRNRPRKGGVGVGIRAPPVAAIRVVVRVVVVFMAQRSKRYVDDSDRRYRVGVDWSGGL